MRAIGLVLVVLAACTEEGAHLTFLAPDGPKTAATYQLVLASPDLAPMIQPQRVTPAGLSTETVTYYLQSAEVVASGTVDGVDGFTVLVQPSGAASAAFVPFVALYDGAGALVGMGTFHATAGGPPAAILVQRGQVDRYTLDVEPVQEVDDSMPVDTRGAMRVSCPRQDQSTFVSGLVWRPRVGGELRVMLSDGDSAATSRPLDLDCDGHAVDPTDASADCDDTRARFHDGATEACDGEDTNCDSAETFAVACTPPPNGGNVCTSTAGQGVAVCDDSTGTMGQCSSDPTCLCAMGLPGCVKCILGHAVADPAPGETVPCQPGIGQLSTQNLCDGGTPCTVAVLGTRGGWEARVGSSSTSLGPVATGVGSSFVLMTKRPEGPGFAIPGAPGHTVGGVDLDIVDHSGGHHYMGVDLEMDTTDAVCGTQMPYSMACSP